MVREQAPDIPRMSCCDWDAPYPVIRDFISLPFKSSWIIYVDGKAVG